MPKLEIVYRGYSFFEYRIGSQRLFVDPAFSAYDRGDWVRRWKPEPCDCVFVTHRHFDHFLDSLDVLEESDAQLIAAPFICDYVRRRIDLPRDRTVELRDGEHAKHPSWRVMAVDADHRGFRGLWAQLMRYPSEALAIVRTQLGTPASEAMQSFLFRFGALSVQHHGEGLNDATDFAQLEQLVREEARPDIVVCAGELTFAEDVAEAIEILEPRVVLLYAPHDDIWRRFHIRSWPLSRFTAEIKKVRPETVVVEMTPDTRYDVDL